MKLLYLVPDLTDPAMARRVSFLREGGARLVVAGFRRPGPSLPLPCDVTTIELGRTENGRLLHRAVAVAAAMVRMRRWRSHAADAPVIMARNLEMLMLGAVALWRQGAGGSLVYECLDLHRLLLAPHWLGRLLRALERRLLQRCAFLVISSPGFVAAHFAASGIEPGRVLLLENKLLPSEVANGRPALTRPLGPPWRIGWFGILRCRQSLAALAHLVTSLPGQVEVEIRGRPARDVIPEFDAIVAATPGLSFGGPYDRSRDLEHLYGRVHFTWAIDCYEAAGNSDWLLPNRLYEGSFYGAVPLAIRGVETARWLQRHEFGVLLDPELPNALVRYIASLTAVQYEAEQRRLAAVEVAEFMESNGASRAFVQRLGALSSPIRAAIARPVQAAFR